MAPGKTEGRRHVSRAVPLLVTSIGLFVLIILLPWDPEVYQGFNRVPDRTESTQPLESADYTRDNIHFPSHGTQIEAFLYIPKVAAKTCQHAVCSHRAPIVIMGHGLGAQRDFGLHKTADRLASSGLAVLCFDYRNFGGSDGEPRNLISPRRHVEDWEEVFKFVKSGGLGPAVDTSNIALWGTSYGGGHAIVTAAKAGTDVKAVLAMVPHLDGVAASKNSIKRRGVVGTLRMVMAALQDYVRSLLGLRPACIKIAGKLGELALMQLDAHELEHYFAKHPKSRMGGWQNMAPARIALETSRYSPVKYLPKVTAPTMFLSAAKDSLCPPEVIRQAAASMGTQVTLVEFNTTHFDMYLSETYEKVVQQTVHFLHQQLNYRHMTPLQAGSQAEVPADQHLVHMSVVDGTETQGAGNTATQSTPSADLVQEA